MYFRRTIASLLALGALALSPAPASAHTELKSSDPAKGTSVSAETFKQVTLTFTEPVTQPTVTIEGWTLGAPTMSGAVVTVPVTTPGAAGAYTLTWRVVSADGDPVSGTIPFTFVAPAPTTTSVPPTTTTEPTTSASGNVSQPAPADDGIPGWVWIVAAAVVVLGAGGFVLAKRASS